ncbi:hypothetical protein D3C87_1686010 [compost metagenome]
MGITIGIVRQTHPLQRRIGLDQRLPLRKSGQPEADIVADGHVRKQRKVLEHQPDATLFRWQEDRRAGNLLAVEQQAAGALHLDAGGDPQERRLAGTGRAEQAKDLAGLGRQADALDRFLGVIAVVNIFEGQARREGDARCPSRGHDGSVLRI